MYAKDDELEKTFEEFEHTFQVKTIKIGKKIDKWFRNIILPIHDKIAYYNNQDRFLDVS